MGKTSSTVTEPRIVRVTNRTQWRTRDLQRLFDMVQREALAVRLNSTQTSYSDPDHSPEALMFVQADGDGHHNYKYTSQQINVEREDGGSEKVDVWQVYLPARIIEPLKVIECIEDLFGHLDRGPRHATLRHHLKRIRQIGHPAFAIQPKNRKRRKYHMARLRKESP